MAIFDPNPQEVGIQDFRGAVKPISQPEGNKGLGTALSGFGQGIKEAGEIVKDTYKVDDYLNKEAGKNETIARNDVFQGQSIENLEGQVRSLGGDPGSTAPDPLLPQGDYAQGELPTPVAGVGDAVNRFNNPAKAIKADNDLERSARLMLMSKQLRANYPGYRDYIDAQVKKATGLDPANYRIRALTESISALTAKTDDPRKKAISSAYDDMHKGIPGMDQHILALENNVPGAVENYLRDSTKYNSSAYALKQEMERFQYEKAAREHNAFQAGSIVDNLVRNDTADILSTNSAAAGTNTPGGSLAWLQGIERLPPDLVGQKAVETAQTLTQRIEATRAKAISLGGQKQPIIGPDGKPTGGSYTLEDAMGGRPAYIARVNENLKWMEQVRDSLVGKDYTGASYYSKLAEARKNELFNKITEGPTGELFTKAEYLKQFPEYFRDDYQRTLTDGKKKQMSDHLSAVTLATNARIDNPKEPGAPSPSAAKAAVDKVNNEPSMSPSDKKKVAESIVDHAQVIADPKTPIEVKREVAKDFFSQYSHGVLGSFDTNGRYSNYAQFARPDMVREMKKLGGEEWNNYQGYMKREFSEVLFKNDLRSLQQLNSLHPDLHIHWNDKDERFGVDFGDDTNIDQKGSQYVPKAIGGGDPTVTYNQIRQVSAAVNRINHGLGSMKNVLREAGGNVDAQLIGIMKEAGGELPQLQKEFGPFQNKGNMFENRLGKAESTASAGLKLFIGLMNSSMWKQQKPPAIEEP